MPRALSVVLVLALAFATLIEPSVRATTIALVVVGLLLVLVGSLLGSPEVVRRWAWASLALHALLSVAIWFDGRLVGPDTSVYQGQAERLVAFWSGQVSISPPLTPGKEAFPVLLASIYRLLGEHPTAALMVCAGAMAATVLVTADTARRWGGSDAEWIAAAAATLVPPLVYWGSQLLREPFAYLVLAVALNAAARLTDRFRLGSLIALITALVLLLPVRGPLAFLTAGALFLAIGFANRSLGRGVLTQVVVVVVIVVSVAFVAPRYAGFEKLSGTDLESIQRSRDELAATGTTGFGSTADVSSVGQALAFLPGASLTAALGPFPWQVGGAGSVALLDAWFLYVVYWLCFRGIRRMRMRKDRRWLLAVVPYAFLILSQALGSANFGVLIRMRAQGLVFLIPLAAVGASWKADRADAAQVTDRPSERGAMPEVAPSRYADGVRSPAVPAVTQATSTPAVIVDVLASGVSPGVHR